jgi:hypothetical protein
MPNRQDSDLWFSSGEEGKEGGTSNSSSTNNNNNDVLAITVAMITSDNNIAFPFFRVSLSTAAALGNATPPKSDLPEGSISASNGFLSDEEIDSIVSAHISFGEKLESAPQEVEAQIINFLLEQTNKKPSKAIILSEEQLNLWHSLQNTLRLGARISTANATKELIKNIKNYTQKNTCRNFDKVNEGLGIAVDLLDRAQKSFQENNVLFGQTFLDQAHKVLATFAPLALQITTDSIQFSKED